jgi:DUF971 family protein
VTASHRSPWAYNRGVRVTTPLIGRRPLNHDETDRRTPIAIDLDAQHGLMRIVWADGHESLYELPALRRSCPCAGCSGEMGRPGSVDASTALTRQQTTLADVQQLNRFGLQLIWADGHDDGLFSYALLRTLCPCDACAGARMSR